jgi:hypothetical protein
LDSQFSALSEKFTILTSLHKEFGTEIPSHHLKKLNTPSDVIQWYVQKFESDKPVQAPQLPSNLKMVLEPLKKKERMKAVPKTISKKKQKAIDKKKNTKTISDKPASTQVKKEETSEESK